MSFSETINQMADVCRRDAAFIQGVKSALLESGLASLCGLTIDEAKLDPFRPCPANWTAMQIAFFDNGELPKVRNRPKIQRTRMRHGANIMVWTRQEVNFGNKAHVAWQANIHLWTAEEAKAIVRDLRDEGYVDDATVEMIDQATDGAGECVRFSVPLLKNATGTRWMRQHLVATSLNDGCPDQVVVLFPDGNGFASSEPFPDYLADGKPLSGKAISQARFARSQSLAQWASEIIL